MPLSRPWCERVCAEEIEEVLKTHDDVDDALRVGVPDECRGHAVTGFAPEELGLG
jgi:acyl-coenzyme A synthetase/AMP-(fatty) acid ligase